MIVLTRFWTLVLFGTRLGILCDSHFMNQILYPVPCTTAAQQLLRRSDTQTKVDYTVPRVGRMTEVERRAEGVRGVSRTVSLCAQECMCWVYAVFGLPPCSIKASCVLHA